MDSILLFSFVVVFLYKKSGLSRELFEQWCTDRRNGVIIAGYCVEGTLAKVISCTLFLHCSGEKCDIIDRALKFFMQFKIVKNFFFNIVLHDNLALTLLASPQEGSNT